MTTKTTIVFFANFEIIFKDIHLTQAKEQVHTVVFLKRYFINTNICNYVWILDMIIEKL